MWTLILAFVCVFAAFWIYQAAKYIDEKVNAVKHKPLPTDWKYEIKENEDGKR